MATLTNAELVAALTGRRRPVAPSEVPGLRFAFYGRVSTSTFQDVQTSRAWQRAVSDELIEGVGSVVAEFFDVGVSRRWSWLDRPEAAALLAAAAGPDRDFDAVVVGEYERAFHGDQFRQVVARLNLLGVEVWLPEAGGPVELGSPVHEALMVLLGAQAQREVARARQRVLAAMRSQTRLQGRFLGGRPPYGYPLVDGGRHPNPVHGRWGRRVQVLAPDPVTAPWVRWVFAERARGRTVASLARELNERGVVCPSGADPGRNAHRSGERWIVRTVAMILENPRYTGRQVWNRSSTTGHGPGGRPGGRGSGVLRWNPVSEWEVSERIVHEPLVDDETFVAVQGLRVAQPAKDGEVRRYLLAGLVVCGLCSRRMDGHWVHGRAGYRCRHGFTSAKRRSDGEPRNLYVREDHLLEALSHLLARTAGPVEEGVGEELVDQVREQRLQIHYDDHRLEIRPAPLMLKTMEPARRPVQPALALDWRADVKVVEI
ncbi:Recombinase zinc beta ribbon domain-containing protein [Lentzea waywayandensis]|uniref:Recombinase zinc beta ribbon domain-containing protein n=1 Tax=Lentzea waywayandensis TaxID=84724 RepID=A0A1I6FGS0_9PSEU|nr:recombinase family protein [Lentzea waywayandensis]SFR29094.1 Recombinase zinc beta ribbon domain-containing protein [Lentzea waywayandensis]